MKIAEFQDLIHRTYHHRDKKRGLDRNFIWLMEEVGELAEGVRLRDHASMKEEVADVLAWLCTVADLADIDVQEAVLAKYGKGCPRCKATPCQCPP